MGSKSRSRIVRFILLIVVIAVAYALFSKLTAPPPEPASTPTEVDVAEPGSEKKTLDDALAVAQQGLDFLEQNLVDYRGRLIKREQVDGQLMPENQIEFKIRFTRR